MKFSPNRTALTDLIIVASMSSLLCPNEAFTGSQLRLFCNHANAKH